MDRRTGVLLTLLLASCLLLDEASADYEFFNVSQSPGQSSQCVVASSPGGTVLVAWQEASSEIWTRSMVNRVWQPAVCHGTGRFPAVCHGAGTFALAYAVDTAILLWEGDGLVWSEPQEFDTGGGEQTARPDFGVPPPGSYARIYLVWEEDWQDVWFTQKVEGTWQEPELVSQDMPILDSPNPQVEPTWVGAVVGPRVYYFGADGRIDYKEYDGASWSDASSIGVDAWFGSRMDVAAGPTLLHCVLSLGPQPT
jgi:hypothetical protein